MAIGIWSGITGIAVALGPLVGGAVVQSIALALDLLDQRARSASLLAPLAARWLAESHGPYGTLDLRGLALGSTGLFGIVFGLVRAQSLGWTSARGARLAGRRRSRCWSPSSSTSCARAEPMLPM